MVGFGKYILYFFMYSKMFLFSYFQNLQHKYPFWDKKKRTINAVLIWLLCSVHIVILPQNTESKIR